jgi:hypothetical protein
VINEEACRWMAVTADETRDDYRRITTERIIDIGEKFKKNGTCDRYMANVDKHTREVLGKINIPLIEYLIWRTGYHDVKLTEMLYGAPLMGVLETSGYGIEKEMCKLDSMDELWRGRRESNKKMARSIRESDKDDEVMRQTREEALLGRMSTPVKYDEATCTFDGIFSSRFGIDQGETMRCVDNATSSGCNPCAAAGERIREHRLDTFFMVVQYLRLT